MILRRLALCCALLAATVWCRPAVAQSLPEPTAPQLDLSDFLRAPPPELLEQGLKPLPPRPPDTRLREGLRPFDVSAEVLPTAPTPAAAGRGDAWDTVQYHWQASGLRYRPLYFEDAMLERHGQSRAPLVQPLASGTRFLLTVPVLPYAMVVNPPHPAQSALGHFRPGSGAPLLLQRPPWQADAAAAEGAAWVGLIFLIP